MAVFCHRGLNPLRQHRWMERLSVDTRSRGSVTLRDAGFTRACQSSLTLTLYPLTFPSAALTCSAEPCLRPVLFFRPVLQG